MRVTKLLFMLLLFTVCLKGQNQTRIALSPRSTLPMSLVAQGLDRKCSGILFTSDISKADYVLEASDTDVRYEFTRWRLLCEFVTNIVIRGFQYVVSLGNIRREEYPGTFSGQPLSDERHG